MNEDVLEIQGRLNGFQMLVHEPIGWLDKQIATRHEQGTEASVQVIRQINRIFMHI